MFREGPAVAYIAVIPATKPQVALGDISYRLQRKEEAAPVFVPVAAEEEGPPTPRAARRTV